ncbi:MAG: tRNA (N6-isopentenyl adenosine(37)-C2)-methylthiotransferase MiaB [Eubacteriales bacterium]|nr:tRNA (N6-isopentenyl adenosine(37)-C2)-methylthiotransferase MiaB [Eubacteriales bacterium]
MSREIDFQQQNLSQENMSRVHSMSAGKKYFIFTYGCQMNTHDSEKLAGMLEEMGYGAAAHKEEADLILLNTCCVREHAEIKVYGNLGALSQQKRQNPKLILGVCGCMMQQADVADAVVRRFPAVDLVFGTQNVHDFPTLLLGVLNGRQHQVEVSSRAQDEVVEHMPVRREISSHAWVTIMYGCNNFCSYCIVPYVRGRERSRAPEAILAEIHELEAQGVREITLLGQNVNSYGNDGGNLHFAQLLETIAQECDKIIRIRFMTSHPKDLSDELIDVMSRYEKICKQVHLPVQSGSDRILKEMNRRYDHQRYEQIVSALREKMPQVGLTTDVIVGFPGETEEDFEQTLELFRRVRFLSAYTFKYSRRTGTAAAEMAKQIPVEVKKERLARLNALQKEITQQVHQEMVGKVLRVLVAERNPRSAALMSGQADEGYRVTFQGGEELIGQIVNVRITAARQASLLGERI